MRCLALLRRSCAAARARHCVASLETPSRSGLVSGVGPPLQPRRQRSRHSRGGAPPAAAASSDPPAAAAAAASSASPPPPPPPPPWSLYAHPALYDALFAFRDFPAELAFVADALAAHGRPPGSPLKVFLDAGCGPARHARAAAATAGVTALALDASPAMLAYATAAAAAEGVALTTVEADFTSPGGLVGGAPRAAPALAALPPADAALAAQGTLAHAVSPGAPLAALTTLASALRPGGVLVLELGAADDVFDGTLIGGDAWDVAVGRGVVEAAADAARAGPPPPPAPPPPAAPGGFGGGGGGGDRKSVV